LPRVSRRPREWSAVFPPFSARREEELSSSGSHTTPLRARPYTAFQIDLGSPVNWPKVARNAPGTSTIQPGRKRAPPSGGCDHPSTRAWAASASRISLLADSSHTSAASLSLVSWGHPDLRATCSAPAHPDKPRHRKISFRFLNVSHVI
jgi:hypothetical protein